MARHTGVGALPSRTDRLTPLPPREQVLLRAQVAGLDVRRVRDIADRIARREWGPPLPHWLEDTDVEIAELEFSVSLNLALESLPRAQVLPTFATEDLRRRLSRGVVTRWLADICPERVYTLDERGHLVREFIEHLNRNKEELLRTGYPAANSRFRHPPLDSVLGDLYPDSFQLEDPAELRALLRFAPAVDSDDWDVDRLNELYRRQLAEERRKVFDVKVAILRRLGQAVRERTATGLSQDCLRLVTRTLTPDEITFLLHTDRLYDTLAAGRQLSLDMLKERGLLPGGLTALLDIVGWYEVEVQLRKYDRMRTILGDLVELDTLGRPQLRVASYFAVLGQPAQSRLDAAIDVLLAPVPAEADPWKTRISDFLATSLRDVVDLSVVVQERHAPAYAQYMRPLAEWARAHQETTGHPPQLALSGGMAGPGAGVGGNTFRKEGDFWTICYQGQVVYMADKGGWRYIAHLLRHEGQDIHALALEAAVRGNPDTAIDEHHRRMGADGLGAYGLSVARIDGRAARSEGDRTEYQRRQAQIKEHEEELAQAQANNDLEMAAGLEETIQLFKDNLTATFNKYGEERDPSSPTEKARKTISVAIKRSFKAIEGEHVALHKHLTRAIRTGTFFSYSPDTPTDWNLQ